MDVSAKKVSMNFYYNDEIYYFLSIFNLSIINLDYQIPNVDLKRGVAQSGSARALGARGRRFKSSHPEREVI